MKASPSAARLIFVIHLEGPESTPADVARIQHVVHLFRGHRVRATWSIANCQSLQRMHQRALLGESDELALAISPLEVGSQTFRASLRKRLSMIQSATGTKIGLITGEPTSLRSHAAFLSEQHLRGVLSNIPLRPHLPTCAPLPCGLWQLSHTLAIPQTSWLARWLPGGSDLRRLNKQIANHEIVLISVDAPRIAHTSPRHLQSLERLLREVSLSASRDEIAITTAGEIIDELSAHRTPRPQHSILKPLAA
jgi:hypothetical protein